VPNPEDRPVAIGALVEKAGGRLGDLWFTFCDHDIVFNLEAPDPLAAGPSPLPARPLATPARFSRRSS
jgi:uncharacterized protein with GYD domain